MTGPARDLWFDNRFRTGAPLGLYCFPFAGGSATYFAKWSGAFTGAVDLVPVRLPGRDARLAEAFAPSIHAVAAEVTDLLTAEPGRIVLFGHSMGAIIAFEVARLLQAAGRPAEHLVVSGRPAPTITRPRTPVSELPRDRFLDALRDYGATPDALLRHQGLLDLLLPMLRADFAMIERYRHRPGPPLTCPVTAWCGDADADVPPASMAAWHAHTSGPFTLNTRSGGHFFVDDHYPEIAADLQRVVA